jgi:predicted site-specific integrase-resolvase
VQNRLARFGVGLVELLLPGYGVSVVSLGGPEDESAEWELVGDVLAVVAGFSGWLYGRRWAEATRLRAAVAAGGDGL